MSRLTGKVALVSGGARGIGAAVAEAMVAEGAKVVLGDILHTDAEAVAARLGPSAAFVTLDVTRPEDRDTAVGAATDRHGNRDVLVNTAGIVNFAAIDVFTHKDWEKVIGVNLTGTFNGIKAAVPALKRAGGGSIINLSSTAGLRAYPMVAAYVASKFGVRGLTKAAALDLARFGIRVNSVHPGWILTPMTAGAPMDTTQFSLGRAGDPNEIARLIVFLASDESSFSTGAEFVADGGESAGRVDDAIQS
jgi:3alpha(or 20beta)-hydroxysteroid dehydrogenase